VRERAGAERLRQSRQPPHREDLTALEHAGVWASPLEVTGAALPLEWVHGLQRLTVLSTAGGQTARTRRTVRVTCADHDCCARPAPRINPAAGGSVRAGRSGLRVPRSRSCWRSVPGGNRLRVAPRRRLHLSARGRARPHRLQSPGGCSTKAWRAGRTPAGRV
jgi:hypothetical protein